MFNLKGPQEQNPRTTYGPRTTVWKNAVLDYIEFWMWKSAYVGVYQLLNLLQLVNVLCACTPVYGLCRVNLQIVIIFFIIYCYYGSYEKKQALSVDNGAQCLSHCFRFHLITNIEKLPYLKITRLRSAPLPRRASSTAHCSIPNCENLRAGCKSVSGSVECRSAADWMFVLLMLI